MGSAIELLVHSQIRILDQTVSNSFETFTKIDGHSSLAVSNCHFKNLVGDSGAAFMLKNSVFEISDTVFELTHLHNDPAATLAASYTGVRP